MIRSKTFELTYRLGFKSRSLDPRVRIHGGIAQLSIDGLVYCAGGMSFLDTVERARAFLQRNGRVSVRALAREFSLGESVDELVEELIEVQRVARRDGNVLEWVGEGAAAQPVSPSPETPNAAAPAATDSGERRQLTVMFCDLVGSTELAQRIDPEELREFVREYRAICVEATKRFDGHVAQYLGDGVMVYFGYPQAHEDDAGRAIRAGLEIQRALGERPEGRRIDARIGIHTGLSSSIRAAPATTRWRSVPRPISRLGSRASPSRAPSS